MHAKSVCCSKESSGDTSAHSPQGNIVFNRLVLRSWSREEPKLSAKAGAGAGARMKFQLGLRLRVKIN
jgi:hypothetical protein